MKNKKSIGLPGGPNEFLKDITQYISVEGYKRYSKDINNPVNIIESGSITMEDVDFPVMGTDNLGNSQMMMPGNNYQFPGDSVLEVPMAQDGTEIPDEAEAAASNNSFLYDLEKLVNKSLGDINNKARDFSENPEEMNNIDNMRHASGGRYAAEAIQQKVKDIPYLGGLLDFVGVDKAAGFIGSNVMGVGHELRTIFGGDERPFLAKLQEMGEDTFNNYVGSIVGSLSIDDSEKDEVIKYLSYNNLLPDGYVRTEQGKKDGFSEDIYFKDEDGKRKTAYQRGGGLLDKTMKCNSCGWSWKAADGGADVSTCHKCGGSALPKAQDGRETYTREQAIARQEQLVEYANEYFGGDIKKTIEALNSGRGIAGDKSYPEDASILGTNYNKKIDSPRLEAPPNPLQIGNSYLAEGLNAITGRNDGFDFFRPLTENQITLSEAANVTNPYGAFALDMIDPALITSLGKGAIKELTKPLDKFISNRIVNNINPTDDYNNIGKKFKDVFFNKKSNTYRNTNSLDGNIRNQYLDQIFSETMGVKPKIKTEGYIKPSFGGNNVRSLSLDKGIKEDALKSKIGENYLLAKDAQKTFNKFKESAPKGLTEKELFDKFWKEQDSRDYYKIGSADGYPAAQTYDRAFNVMANNSGYLDNKGLYNEVDIWDLHPFRNNGGSKFLPNKIKELEVFSTLGKKPIKIHNKYKIDKIENFKSDFIKDLKDKYKAANPDASHWDIERNSTMLYYKLLEKHRGFIPDEYNIEQVFKEGGDIEYYQIGGQPTTQEGNGEYKVSSGDTFYGIANKNNVTWDELKKANPNISYNNLKLNQSIVIPKKINTSPYTSKPAPSKDSNIFDYNAISDYLVNNRGGTKDTWGQLADLVAFHESGPAQRWDPRARQISQRADGSTYDGPGRGVFQFENESFNTALKRYKNIASAKGYSLKNDIVNAKSADELSLQDQYALFLANLIESRAKLSDFADGDISALDVWLTGHKNVEAKGNRNSFLESKNAAEKETVKRGYRTFQEGGEPNLFDMYSGYINGDYDGTEFESKAALTYDKLNRVYYKEAKDAGMNVPNYIMTYVIGNS